MNARCLLVLLATLAIAHAADPTPPPLQDTPLPAIKGSIKLPQGWFVKESTEDGVTIYQMTREKVETENDAFTAGLILTVTTKVPDRTKTEEAPGMKPSEYARELLASQDDKDLKKSTEGSIQVIQSEDKIESDSGTTYLLNVGKANDQTGTLYFLTWQSPMSEDATLAPVRDAIISSFKFDPSY